ncbi:MULTISPECIES: hypothetical protein [unclassified Anabaena]|uniref:hypothetical protein n=1 Tax=unclassified Anabaena TaxID=2619674 RepID=UPI0014486F21|nr:MULTISPECIES: hypothetical protein [unclassified Anabaena]MTJ07647.1 hypothetical protein [Anabaena sp. UHCC 0204]MTJ51385.1 hypothetical protein [Anabaena sp. UHCC 0253]
MFYNTQLNQPQLFISLSEAEQESLVGGQISSMFGEGLDEGNLFFQKTDIETEGNNNLNLAAGDSSSENTKYKLSQITMIIPMNLGMGQLNNIDTNKQNNNLMLLFKYLFS